MTKNNLATDSGLRNEKDAAKYLNVSIQTLTRLRKAGRISYYRIAKRVLYGQEQLEAFLLSANQQVCSPFNIGETKGGNDA
jgi:excisionase family DNA binding protein